MLKSVLGYLEIALMAVFAVGIFAAAHSALYTPVRLYYTGQVEECTVLHKTTRVELASRSVPRTVYTINVDAGYDLADVSKPIYDSLAVGATAHVYYSHKVNYGFICAGSAVGFLACIRRTDDINAFMMLMAALLVIAYYVALAGVTVKAFRRIHASVAAQIPAGVPAHLRPVMYLSGIAPYSSLGLIMALLGLVIMKVVLSIEANNLLNGFFLWVSITLLVLFPAIAQFLVQRFNTSMFSIVLRAVVGIVVPALAIWNGVKVLQSIELSQFSDWMEFASSIADVVL